MDSGADSGGLRGGLRFGLELGSLAVGGHGKRPPDHAPGEGHLAAQRLPDWFVVDERRDQRVPVADGEMHRDPRLDRSLLGTWLLPRPADRPRLDAGEKEGALDFDQRDVEGVRVPDREPEDEVGLPAGEPAHFDVGQGHLRGGDLLHAAASGEEGGGDNDLGEGGRGGRGGHGDPGSHGGLGGDGSRHHFRNMTRSLAKSRSAMASPMPPITTVLKMVSRMSLGSAVPPRI